MRQCHRAPAMPGQPFRSDRRAKPAPDRAIASPAAPYSANSPELAPGAGMRPPKSLLLPICGRFAARLADNPVHDRRIRERVEEGKAFLVRWFAESRIRSDRCAGVREAEGVAGLRRARRKRLHFVDGFANELICGILLPSLMFLHAALQKFRGPASGTAPVCVVSRHVRPAFF